MNKCLQNTLVYLIGFFICTTLFPTFTFSTSTQGGYSLVYVHSAQVIPKGHLQFFGGTRYYGKVASSGNNAYTLWNVQGFMTFNYGAGKHIELALSPIIYQDTNGEGGNSLDGGANFPDDLYIHMKFGSYGTLESPLLFGGMLSTRFPMGKQHNIIYEPYSGGRVEVGFTALVTYFSNVSFPETEWSLHTNIGYLNHNDVGANLTDEKDDPKPKRMSSELLLNIGWLYPAEDFNFSTEISARTFLVRPPETAYSCEYVSYLTFGVSYQPYGWLSFETGFDIQLLAGKDLSEYQNTSLQPPPEDFPNYPTWRGTLGLKLSILPRDVYSSKGARMRKQTLDRRELLEKMMLDQQDTEDAEQELLRIRAERRRVEEELERLRKMLEEESKREGRQKEDSD